MKKIILLITIMTLSVLGYSQITRLNIYSIKDSTTVFGIELPRYTTILNNLDGKLWQLTANAISTKTLETSTKRLIGGGGSGGVEVDPIYAGDSVNIVWFSDLINIIPLSDTLSWLEPVISIRNYTACTSGDSLERYIALTTGSGWTANRVYECNGASWIETIPVAGNAITVIDSGKVYVYNGSSWIVQLTTNYWVKTYGNKLFNTNGGDVGINKTNPTATLDVNGTIRSSLPMYPAALYISGKMYQNGDSITSFNTNKLTISSGINSGNTAYISMRTNNGNTATTERFRITANGNFLYRNVNSTTGATRFAVFNGDSLKWQTVTLSNYLLYSDTASLVGTKYYINSQIASNKFWSRNISKIYPTTLTDSVGIGTNSPTARLHVKGSVANSTAYAEKVDNSSNQKLLYVRNDGQIEFKNYTFPIADGAINQVLKTNGSGTLGWATATWQQDSLLRKSDGTVLFTTFPNDSSIKAGKGALKYVVTGNGNAAFGYNAGSGLINHTKNYSSYFGINSGISDTSDYNNMFGYESGLHNLSGHDNLFFGYKSGYANTTGYQNVYIGNNSGLKGVGNYSNVFIGNNTGKDSTSIFSSVLIGESAGIHAKNSLISIGANSGSWTTGNSNTYVGVSSGQLNTTGRDNTYFGASAGITGVVASFCTLIGSSSGYANLGNYNSALGYRALFANTSGTHNLALGHEALFANTTATENVSVGDNSSHSLNASYNTVVGTFANNVGTGTSNTLVGNRVMFEASAGTYNAMFGFKSGTGNSGSYNVFMGSQTGYATAAGSRNIFIGYKAGYSNTGSDSIVMDNEDNRANPYFSGNMSTHKMRINATIDCPRGVTTDMTALNLTGSINDFYQTNIQNTSTGTGAQAGYSATADNGTATTNFMWMGINNSTYNNPQPYNVGSAGDGNILSLYNNLCIANGSAGKGIYFYTGGTATSNRRAFLDSLGLFGIGQLAPTASLHVKGSGATSATYSLKVENSSNANLLSVRNDGNVIISGLLSAKNPHSILYLTGATYSINQGVNDTTKLTPTYVTKEANNMTIVSNAARVDYAGAYVVSFYFSGYAANGDDYEVIPRVLRGASYLPISADAKCLFHGDGANDPDSNGWRWYLDDLQVNDQISVAIVNKQTADYTFVEIQFDCEYKIE